MLIDRVRLNICESSRLLVSHLMVMRHLVVAVAKCTYLLMETATGFMRNSVIAPLHEGLLSRHEDRNSLDRMLASFYFRADQLHAIHPRSMHLRNISPAIRFTSGLGTGMRCVIRTDQEVESATGPCIRNDRCPLGALAAVAAAATVCALQLLRQRQCAVSESASYAAIEPFC